MKVYFVFWSGLLRRFDSGDIFTSTGASPVYGKQIRAQREFDFKVASIRKGLETLKETPQYTVCWKNPDSSLPHWTTLNTEKEAQEFGHWLDAYYVKAEVHTDTETRIITVDLKERELIVG